MVRHAAARGEQQQQTCVNHIVWYICRASKFVGRGGCTIRVGGATCAANELAFFAHILERGLAGLLAIVPINREGSQLLGHGNAPLTVCSSTRALLGVSGGLGLHLLRPSVSTICNYETVLASVCNYTAARERAENLTSHTE